MINPELWLQLADIAIRDGTTVGELAEKAIRKFLAKEEKKG